MSRRTYGMRLIARYRYFKSHGFDNLESMWLAIDALKLSELENQTVEDAVYYQNLSHRMRMRAEGRISKLNQV